MPCMWGAGGLSHRLVEGFERVHGVQHVCVWEWASPALCSDPSGCGMEHVTPCRWSMASWCSVAMVSWAVGVGGVHLVEAGGQP